MYNVAIWKSGDTDPVLLITALDGGKWSASRPGRFIPGQSALDTD
jgi:hypothetical protein